MFQKMDADFGAARRASIKILYHRRQTRNGHRIAAQRHRVGAVDGNDRGRSRGTLRSRTDKLRQRRCNFARARILQCDDAGGGIVPIDPAEQFANAANIISIIGDDDRLTGAIGGDRTVLRHTHLHVGIRRRACPGNHQLLVAFQHQLLGFARRFREFGANVAPLVRAKLRSEAAAHNLAIDVNLACFKTGDIRQPVCVPRYVLRRRPYPQFTVFEFAHLPVRFETAMRNRRDPVAAFVHDIRFSETSGNIAILTRSRLTAHVVRVCVVHDVFKDFVFNLDRVDGINRDFFGRCGHCGNRITRIQEFVANVANYLHNGYTRHAFRSAYVDRFNFAVGIRRD